MANTGPRSTSSPGSGQNRSASPPALEGSTALRASGVQGRSPVPCAAAARFSGSQGHTRTSGKGVSGKHEVLSPAVWISCRPASPPRALVASEAPCSPVPTSELHFKAKARSQAGHAALSCRQWALGNSAGVVFSPVCLPRRTLQTCLQMESKDSKSEICSPSIFNPNLYPPTHTHTHTGDILILIIFSFNFYFPIFLDMPPIADF